MELTDILKPSAVKTAGKLTSKKRLFQELGDIASSSLGLSSEEIVDALLDRENLGPTGVGKGVALPHARISGLTSVTGMFLKLDQPMDFNSVDRQPVDLIFALFAPEDAGVEHLKALALVSRTMRDQGTCAKLRANTDASTLHAIMVETPSSRAA